MALSRVFWAQERFLQVNGREDKEKYYLIVACWK